MMQTREKCASLQVATLEPGMSQGDGPEGLVLRQVYTERDLLARAGRLAARLKPGSSVSDRKDRGGRMIIECSRRMTKGWVALSARALATAYPCRRCVFSIIAVMDYDASKCWVLTEVSPHLSNLRIVVCAHMYERFAQILGKHSAECMRYTPRVSRSTNRFSR